MRDLLEEPDSPRYFGRTKLKRMSDWVKKERKKGKEEKLRADFKQVSEWLGSHPRQDIPAESDQSEFAKGYRVYEERCSACHSYKGTGGGEANAPDFTGYGDANWIRLMIMSPNHPLRYGSNNRMPAFRDLEGVDGEVKRAELERIKKTLEEAAGDDEKKKKQVEESTRVVNLSDIDRELIIRWLLQDYRVVFGGEPISAAPPR